MTAVTTSSSDKLLIISSDCHAGALPDTYLDYMPKKYHEAADAWWIQYAREMMKRTGTFFDQEAVEKFSEDGGEEGAGKFRQDNISVADAASDDQIRAMLKDTSSPFAPRRGEFDSDTRLQELEGDGIAGEVVFPQMAPFGAGLLQYRFPVSAEHNREGNRAYNRWLADFCQANPGRHAGVAIINVDDIDVAVAEVRFAKEANLFGGILLPSGTGEQQYYHDPRYEPLWAVCAELDMPIHVHGGWSPDYGDAACATAMYISETDMWSHRAFTALLWAGVFERYPNIKLVFTETGCSWITEHLRRLEWKSQNPLFAHFKKGLSLTPTEYYQRNCYMGASFLSSFEIADRYKIGVDKLMWGSDYPHMEGTWPNTSAHMQETFVDIPDDEVRSILGTTAANIFGFDMEILGPVADRIGPSMPDIKAS